MYIERSENHPNTHMKAEREEKIKYYATKMTIAGCLSPELIRLSPTTTTQNIRPIRLLGNAAGKVFDTYFGLLQQ
jgi:hypothetical protein